MMQRSTLKLATASLLLLWGTGSQAEDLWDIYQLAQESDPQLLSAEAGNLASTEARAQSRSTLLPQINLSAEMAENSVDTSGVGTEDYSSQGYNLSLVQTIYHHDYYVQLRQADASIARANAEFEAARQGLMLRVAEAYFNLLSARDNLDFAQAEKRAIEQQLRQTRQRFDVGLSAITDVHEAQAGYDAAVAQEIAAQNTLDLAREALMEITGQMPGQLIPLTEELPLVQPEPTDIDKWVETALEQNLSLLAADASALTAREEINRREAGHYPTLDLVANHNYSDTSDASFGAERTTNTIGLQLNVPIYSGGFTSSHAREARHLYTQAEQNLEQARRSTVRQTRDAYLGVTAGISQVQARKQALSSAQTALEATQAGFEVGTRTAVDVLNAQREKFRARRDYSRARYDYLLATLRLRQAAGTLDETHLRQINSWLQ